MNSCSDALYTGHILAFACQELGIENIDSDLDNPNLGYLSDTKKRKFIVGLSMRVVEKCTIIGDAIMGKKLEESGDKNMIMQGHYVTMLLSRSSYDGWCEGDGIRIIRCWRLFLPHFYGSGRTKHSPGCRYN